MQFDQKTISINLENIPARQLDQSPLFYKWLEVGHLIKKLTQHSTFKSSWFEDFLFLIKLKIKLLAKYLPKIGLHIFNSEIMPCIFIIESIIYYIFYYVLKRHNLRMQTQSKLVLWKNYAQIASVYEKMLCSGMNLATFLVLIK